jgi:hypothetical protein
VSDVNIPDYNLNMTNASGGLGSFSSANINANVTIGNLANAPNRPDFNAYVDHFNIGSLVSPPLSVNITSLGGVNIGSLLGINLTGGGGVSIAGVGGIALTGGGGITVASGGILISAGGMAITSGGLAVNGGGIQVGAGGILVTGGNVTLPNAQLVMGSNASITMGESNVNGGGITMYGADLNLYSSLSRQSILHTAVIDMSIGGITGSSITDSNALLQINGLSTINGVAYVPLTSNVSVSTLTASNYISTPNLLVDYINGISDLQLGYLAGTSGDITIGANTAEIYMTAPTNIDSLYPTAIYDCSNASIQALSNLSSINGLAYPTPPPPIVPVIFPVSGMVANNYVQTVTANAYYPIVTSDNTAPAYNLNFDVLPFGSNAVTFYVKNLDSNANNIGIGWSQSGPATPAVFFGGASNLYPPGSTNGQYCVCEWDGSNLTVY